MTPGPTIAIDARAAVEEGAGRGRVVRELLRTLARRDDDGARYLLLARRLWPEQPLDERFSWWLSDLPDPLWHVRATVEANRRADVIFATNSYLPAWFATKPLVTLVHDMLAFDRSMSPNKRSAVIERLTIRPAVRRSRSLLVYTEDGERQLVSRFPAAAGKTRLAPLGASTPPGPLPPDEAASLPAAGFVLAVGTLEPRKNLPRLVEAYRSLPADLQAAHPLAVAGRLGWETGETVEALRALGDRARVLGYVSDAALAELYRRAAVFAYPSLGEGFGLPVLEAMAAGAPVVTSDVSSLPYVGGDAVAYCSPRDTASIAAALERLLRDGAERARLSEAGRARAATFSWDAFADVVLSACLPGT
jgi:glycosyltransferase involved in cell wall biosynthesis